MIIFLILLEARDRICKRLRGPGIDSEESILATYVAWRAGTSNRVVLPARQAAGRFLGSLKGLQIRAQGVLAAHLLYINIFISAACKTHICIFSVYFLHCTHIDCLAFNSGFVEV
jgi:hypothetical protein